ncbi:metal-dependent hydrolase, partial [Sulfurirhabdus autotrophica]
PISHLAVPLALSVALGPDMVSPGLMVLALACAVLPDIDAVGMWLGIPYDHTFGHRGFTHSFPFSVALAVMGAFFAPELGEERSIAFFLLLFSAASHGLLDAMTNGGLGIAFFSPFSNKRYFLPWRIIEVSPLNVMQLLSLRGLSVLGSEVRYVWIPCAVFGLAGFVVRVILNAQGV